MLENEIFKKNGIDSAFDQKWRNAIWFWSKYWQTHNYRKYKVSINNSGQSHIWKSLKLTLLLNGNDDMFQILKDKDSTSHFTVSWNLM